MKLTDEVPSVIALPLLVYLTIAGFLLALAASVDITSAHEDWDHDMIVEAAIEEPTDWNLEVADAHYMSVHDEHFTLPR